MKKTILLYLLLGVSISLSAQGIKDKFFHQIGFSLYTDFHYSKVKELTVNANVPDKNGNSTTMDIAGQYRSAEIALISFYYSPSFNIIEKGVENSYSINIPMGIHISQASKEFQGDYFNGSVNTSYYYYSEQLGSISFPVYLTWNTGMGAICSVFRNRKRVQRPPATARSSSGHSSGAKLPGSGRGRMAGGARFTDAAPARPGSRGHRPCATASIDAGCWPSRSSYIHKLRITTRTYWRVSR